MPILPNRFTSDGQCRKLPQLDPRVLWAMVIRTRRGQQTKITRMHGHREVVIAAVAARYDLQGRTADLLCRLDFVVLDEKSGKNLTRKYDVDQREDA